MNQKDKHSDAPKVQVADEFESIAAAYRFCPRCGSPNPSPGSKPFQCSGCGYAAYFGPVTAVGAIIVDELGNSLLVRRARNPGKGKWGLPGGFVDPGESAEQAAIREILEETNLKVSNLSFLLTLPNQYRHRGVVAPVLDLFFEVRVAGQGQIRLAADELDKFVWTHPTNEYLENMAFDSNRRALEHWLSRHSA
jgi:ADP-ribose pyrophosphatase